MKKKVLTTTLLVLFMLVLLFIRHYLILELPIFAYVDYINDDELMVEQAYNIKHGNWLGVYGYNTLLKSPVFPCYLALLSMLGLPYILTTTLIYAIATCLFIYSIKDIIKNKGAIALLFAVILFNPIMFSIDFQRVYRNSLAPSLALFLMSFLNIAFINRNNPKIRWYVFGITCASLVFPFFYYIREDSIWIVPFVVFYLVIILANIVLKCIKEHAIKKVDVIKVMLVFLPVITLVLFNFIVGNINYKHYGEHAVNMSDIDSLQEVLHTIAIVKTDDPKSNATNSRQKMRKLYEVSPTLNSMSETCETLQDIISGRENGDVGDAMYMWVFLETISASGYNTFEKQDEIFRSITKEIKEAIASGKIETQEMTPFFADAAYFKYTNEGMIKNLFKAIQKINEYDSFGIMDTYGSLYSSDVFENRIRMFLEITNDKMLLNNEPRSWNMFGELIKESQTEYIEKMQPKIDVLRTIAKGYDAVCDYVIIIGYASYMIITIVFVIRLIKHKDSELFNSWVVLSGIIGSIVTLCFGVAYTSLTKGNVTISFYLMSGYILNMAFAVMSIVILSNVVIDKFKQRKKVKSERQEEV